MKERPQAEVGRVESLKQILSRLADTVFGKKEDVSPEEAAKRFAEELKHFSNPGPDLHI